MIYVLHYLLIVLYTVFWGTLGVLLAAFDRSGEAVIWVARNWVLWLRSQTRVELDSVLRLGAAGRRPCDHRPRRPRELRAQPRARCGAGARRQDGRDLSGGGQLLKDRVRRAIEAGFDPALEPARRPSP